MVNKDDSGPELFLLAAVSFLGGKVVLISKSVVYDHALKNLKEYLYEANSSGNRHFWCTDELILHTVLRYRI